MAPRPPIQAVIEEQAELDEGRRNWRMVLFNEDGTPFVAGDGGEGGSSVGEWNNLTLINGWTNYNSDEPVGYRFEEGGKVLRFRGVPDGRSRSSTKFADLPSDLADIVTRAGAVAWEYGVGYHNTELAIQADGLWLYLSGSWLALLQGVTISVDPIIGIS